MLETYGPVGTEEPGGTEGPEGCLKTLKRYFKLIFILYTLNLSWEYQRPALWKQLSVQQPTLIFPSRMAVHRFITVLTSLHHNLYWYRAVMGYWQSKYCIGTSSVTQGQFELCCLAFLTCHIRLPKWSNKGVTRFRVCCILPFSSLSLEKKTFLSLPVIIYRDSKDSKYYYCLHANG